MRKNFFILFIFFITACNTLDLEDDPDVVYIRVANFSPIDFKSVYISFPKSEHTFGTINSGRRSTYQKFKQAFRYGYIEVKTERETYVYNRSIMWVKNR